jgi:hypothetical protein
MDTAFIRVLFVALIGALVFVVWWWERLRQLVEIRTLFPDYLFRS